MSHLKTAKIPQLERMALSSCLLLFKTQSELPSSLAKILGSQFSMTLYIFDTEHMSPHKMNDKSVPVVCPSCAELPLSLYIHH